MTPDVWAIIGTGVLICTLVVVTTGRLGTRIERMAKRRSVKDRGRGPRAGAPVRCSRRSLQVRGRRLAARGFDDGVAHFPEATNTANLRRGESPISAS